MIRKLLTAALAGFVVACSLEVDESQLSGRESVTLFEGARLIVGDGSTPVVVLSDALWQQRYTGDTAVIGQTITVDGTPARWCA